MPTPFDTLPAKALADALTSAAGALLATNRAFIEGDHWQGADAWMGPRPIEGEENADVILELTHLGLVSRNVYAEVTERHGGGVIGYPPRWALTVRRTLAEGETPTPAEQALIDEATAALTAWLQRQRYRAKLKQYVRIMLWADGAAAERTGTLDPVAVPGEGRAGLRLRVPASQTIGVQPAPGTTPVPGTPATGVLTVPDLAAALGKVVLEVPAPEGAAMLQDPDTLAECAVITYQDANQRPVYELYFLEDPADAAAAATGVEVIRPPVAGVPAAPGAPGTGAAPAAPLTVFRKLTEQGEERVLLPLGGRLPFFEGRRPLLCTAQVRQGQMALNLALTMVPRNVTMSSFLQDTLLNAQAPGTWVYEGGVRKRFVPGVYEKGPGVTNFVTGATYKDENGVTQLADPSIDHSPPQSPAPSQDAARGHYRDILEECDQVHVLLGAEATPSGRSREEARTDYVASLADTAEPTEDGGMWLIETGLAWAELLMGVPGRYTAVLRAEFQCRINAGPPTDAERLQTAAEWTAGRLSTATAMNRNGVVDVEAEQARIEADYRAQVQAGTAEGGALTILTGAGLGLADAGEYLHLPDDKMAILTRVQAEQEAAAAAADAALALANAAAADQAGVPAGGTPPPGGAPDGQAAPGGAPGTGAGGTDGGSGAGG